MNISKIINNDRTRKAITTLGKGSTLLPIILLETTVTGGRTIQAYKRDGYTEARERFCEESVGAVFWLFGVKMFNKLGDAFGKHFLKIPETNFDVGKDELRTPFENVTADLAKKATKAEKGVKSISKEALAGFKFGKIILSVIAATSFIGFVVPKINQSITRKVISRNKSTQDKKDQPKLPSSQGYISGGSIDDFKRKVTAKKPAFKGAFNPDLLATIAHDLENHPVYKLLATDTGILSGRTINSRNNDERVEVIFRDGVSIYFYMFCTKNIISLMKKAGNYGKIANLDPTSAKQTDDLLASLLEKKDGKTPIEPSAKKEYITMSVKDFTEKTLGSLDEDKKDILAKLENTFKKNNDVISLHELKEHLPKGLHDRALAMSRLQPEQEKLKADLLKKIEETTGLLPEEKNLGAVLTKQQVEDVLRGGEISSPEFLTKMYKESFGKDLTNPYKYIPVKRIKEFRNNIDDYVKTIIEYAEKSHVGEGDAIVTVDVLKKMNNTNLMKYGGFFMTGFLISAAFLSTIIPKTQYLITKLRTGKNQFPGMKDDGARHKLTSK